jgi:hypothetical protein
MALPGTGIVNQGLQRIGINASQVGGSGSIGSSQTVTRYVMAMGVDDNASNFAATDTAQNTRGALTNSFFAMLDAFPTRANQTVSHVCTLGTAQANFTIKGIALHDNTSNQTGSGGATGLTNNVTASSTTLVAGIANQAITKTSSFSLAITVAITYTDNS